MVELSCLCQVFWRVQTSIKGLLCQTIMLLSWQSQALLPLPLSPSFWEPSSVSEQSGHSAGCGKDARELVLLVCFSKLCSWG